MRVLFIILLIFLLTPYLVRWMSPYLMKFFFNNMQKKVEKQHQQHTKSAEAYQQAEKRKAAKKNLGEYVEFEEVEEE